MPALTATELEEAVAALYNTPAIRAARIVPGRSAVTFIANLGETYQAYLWDVDSGSYTQLTFADDPVAQAIPSREGDQVAILRDSDGDELFRLSLVDLHAPGEAERLLTPEPLGRAHIVDWLPGGRSLVLSGNDDLDNFLSRYDLDTGSHTKLLASLRWFEAADVSVDGSSAAISVRRNDNDAEDYDIAVVPTDGAPVTWISTGEGHRDGSPKWSPGGDRLAITSEIDDQTWLVIFDWPDATEVARERIQGDSASLCYWSPDAAWLDFTTSHHGLERLWRASIGQHIAIAEQPARGSVHLAARDGDRIVTIVSAIDQPVTNVTLHDLDHATLATLDVGSLELPLGRAESVDFSSGDGTLIQAWLVRGASGPNPAPAVVYVHGGPTWATFNAWRNDIQALVFAGFTVLAPNYRGSTSFGPAFRKANVGDLGGTDLEDCLAAAEWLRRQPFVDPDRVAIAGGSYGGYMTLWAMVKAPTAFRCGAGLVPVTDWVDDYELADAAFRYFDVYFFGGTPEEQPALYRDRSPLTFVDALAAPLFIGAGRNDSRCPFPPIEKFVEKGWELGKQIEFDVQESEGHGAARKTAAVATELKVLHFLRRHCDLE